MAEAKAALPFDSAHFICIGGAGMSGIALVLHERGCTVTGSDLKASRYVRELEEAGVDVHIGHDAATIDETNPDVVVTSSAIPETNPEVIRARELGIEVWPRAKMLAALGSGFSEVAVAGTHGKTTTSSMIASMLDHLGADPSFLIGGIVEEYATNGRDGKGGYFVCEADESDGSFLYLTPSIAVVTNVEADHLDHYGSIENVERAFEKFMALVGDKGCVVVCGDDERALNVAQRCGARFVTYGISSACDYVCAPASAGPGLRTSCTVTTPSGASVEVVLSANPGVHNLVNATAALAVADILEFDVKQAAQALSAFRGAHRRFTHVGDIAGITVVDDYGHHPTEIAATLKAAAQLDFSRVVECFQPHRYSRTQMLAQEFGTAFDDADILFVMDVFSAGEMPIPGVSGRTVASAVAQRGKVSSVRYIPNRHELIDALCDELQPGDLLITQGAGDVTAIGPQIIDALRERLEKEEAAR